MQRLDEVEEHYINIDIRNDDPPDTYHQGLFTPLLLPSNGLFTFSYSLVLKILRVSGFDLCLITRPKLAGCCFYVIAVDAENITLFDDFGSGPVQGNHFERQEN